MEQVIYQNNGPAEGLDGADLALQRRVAGISPDGEGPQVRGKYFVGVQGLGDGVGDGVAPEDLSEGNAHLGPQDPGLGGLGGDAVELCDLAHGSISTCMYYTGIDPRTMTEVYVPKTYEEKQMQRALLQYRNPKNYNLVLKALKKAGREDLIGFDSKCLIKPLGNKKIYKPDTKRRG